MPFDVQWHDDHSAPNQPLDDAAIDESLLSDDLLELAEQLGDDARRLQSCYPAEKSVNVAKEAAQALVSPVQASPAKAPADHSSSRKRWRMSAMVFGSGSACLLIACFALFTAWQTSSTGKPAPDATVFINKTLPDQPSVEFLASDNQTEGADRLSNARRHTAEKASPDSRVTPVSAPALIGIGNATGPQLEAFYDYLEDEDQTVRLSI